MKKREKNGGKREERGKGEKNKLTKVRKIESKEGDKNKEKK